jgi:hypothetical protein
MPVEMPIRIEISGAGRARLAAALVIAKKDTHAVVHEHNADVGGRFHGDFQDWKTGRSTKTFSKSLTVSESKLPSSTPLFASSPCLIRKAANSCFAHHGLCFI